MVAMGSMQMEVEGENEDGGSRLNANGDSSVNANVDSVGQTNASGENVNLNGESVNVEWVVVIVLEDSGVEVLANEASDDSGVEADEDDLLKTSILSQMKMMRN